jgi:hypothetical protein
MFRSRRLLVVALGIAAGVILFGLYRALPGLGSETAGSHPSAESKLSLPVSRMDSGRSKIAIEQSPDVRRNPETRPVQHLDGATIEMCHRALLGRKYMQASVDDDCSGIAEDDDIGMQLCRQSLVGEHAYLQELTAKAAGCPESLARASDYYIALRDAALAGDVNAQNCFLAGYFNSRDWGDSISETQVNEYLPLARRLIQSAIERGDWAVVHYLSNRPEHPGLLIQAYPFGSEHPDTWYRMNYLLTLGSRSEADSDDAKQIVSIIRSQQRLSPDEAQAAEAWARETYDGYFAATPYDKKVAARSFCNEDLG